jgi:hypothetical protein
MNEQVALTVLDIFETKAQRDHAWTAATRIGLNVMSQMRLIGEFQEN